ncbi:MAG: NADH-quinone oxidoreductase subunit C [Nocardioidaceae bacterium]
MSWLERLQTAYEVEPDPGFGPPTIDVDSEAWLESARIANETLGCGFFDFLTAVDELDDGFTVVAHVASPSGGNVDSVLLRTRVSREQPGLACICAVYSGAGWHERETHEMFGIGFAGHEALEPLLLPDGFEGHPLRKDFVLASRVAKPFPGAKEPGESESDAAPSRRRMRPPGVPDPEDWGPRATRLDSAE